jgi:hypothetical protein
MQVVEHFANKRRHHFAARHFSLVGDARNTALEGVKTDVSARSPRSLVGEPSRGRGLLLFGASTTLTEIRRAYVACQQLGCLLKQCDDP